MPRLNLRKAARSDLREARTWYESRRAGLGDEFLASVAAAFLTLEQHAHRLPPYYRGFRRMLVDRFPYKIFYRIEGETIVVFRILHSARDHTRELP